MYNVFTSYDISYFKQIFTQLTFSRIQFCDRS